MGPYRAACIRAVFRKCIFRKCIFRNSFFENAFFENFANFWRARSRLYQNEILQENMRSTAFFKLYKICILLHRCNLKIFAKNRFEKTAIKFFVKFQQKKLQMSQNLQNVVKFQKFQLENLVDFEKCCKTHIFLQKSEPIQPKTSNIFPKFCQPTLSDVASPPAADR